MQGPSNYYSLNTMTVTQWFDMLAAENNQPKEADANKVVLPMHIYEVNVRKDFYINPAEVLTPGVYYMRASKEYIKILPIHCKAKKLSFAQLVHLSDCFSTVIKNMMPADRLKDTAEEGNLANQFEEIKKVRPEGLKKMRAVVWTKWYEKGWVALIRRCFSAIGNFFKKYDLYIYTGIYLPGNSCTYADKVVENIHRIKTVILSNAINISQENVYDILEVPQEEKGVISFDEIKRRYRRKMLQVHPDRNNGDPVKEELSRRLTTSFSDFEKLIKIKEELAGNPVKIDQEPERKLEPDEQKPHNLNPLPIDTLD
jgi:hypothetical protein